MIRLRNLIASRLKSISRAPIQKNPAGAHKSLSFFARRHAGPYGAAESFASSDLPADKAPVRHGFRGIETRRLMRPGAGCGFMFSSTPGKVSSARTPTKRRTHDAATHRHRHRAHIHQCGPALQCVAQTLNLTAPSISATSARWSGVDAAPPSQRLCAVRELAAGAASLCVVWSCVCVSCVRLQLANGCSCAVGVQISNPHIHSTDDHDDGCGGGIMGAV